MRNRQGFLLREEMMEQENETRGDGERQKEDLEDTSSKSGPVVCVLVNDVSVCMCMSLFLALKGIDDLKINICS